MLGGPKLVTVELSDELAAQAGAKIFTCRILGVGRLIKVSAKVFARSQEFSSDKKDQPEPEPEPEPDTKKPGRKIDPYLATEENWKFRYPPDLLLPAVVVTADGDTVTHDAVEEWVMDLPMGAANHLGLAVLLASDLIEETDDESGKDSGGSSVS